MTRDDFEQKSKSGVLRWERRSVKEEIISPNDIIVDKEWNARHPSFWNHHGRTKDEYLDYVSSGRADNAEPPEVYKWGDKYVLVGDGNHRVAASQELNRPINVKITGECVEQNQSQGEEQETSM